MSTHHCPGPGCTAEVPSSKLACPRHWGQVSPATGREVYAAYRSDPGSERHVQAMQDAIAEMRT